LRVDADVYSTCIFCSGALGRNESIEHFPVGRKLAFDAARGRLWVVCPSCARWNLTPLDSRWEAIEEAERAYRDTRLRASTDNVGLAKLKEGTELVRIGKPMLPEFAPWRYADVFRKRYWNGVVMMGAGGLAYGGGQAFTNVMMNGAADGAVLGFAAIGGMLSQAGVLWVLRRRQARQRAVIRVEGTALPVNRLHASMSEVWSDPATGSWTLNLMHKPQRSRARYWMNTFLGRTEEYDQGLTMLNEADSRATLGRIIPFVNVLGGRPRTIRDAVDVVEHEPDANALLSGRVQIRGAPVVAPGRNALLILPSSVRLALEMQLHESDERRALDGELRELEDRWREAEEIANIADNMFLPADIERGLDRLKARGELAEPPSTETH
jgi:hypothetical protein